jgi:hypothetical protein
VRELHSNKSRLQQFSTMSWPIPATRALNTNQRATTSDILQWHQEYLTNKSYLDNDLLPDMRRQLGKSIASKYQTSAREHKDFAIRVSSLDSPLSYTMERSQIETLFCYGRNFHLHLNSVALTP